MQNMKKENENKFLQTLYTNFTTCLLSILHALVVSVENYSTGIQLE